jgi:Holliday junction resolvase RusA-like endonuclease
MFSNNKGTGKGRIVSKKYKQWKNTAGFILKSQGLVEYKGRFRLYIQLNDKRQGDCDNRIKPLCDLLVSMGVVEGDQKKYMKGVSVDWDCVDECVVTIRPLPPIVVAE